MLIELHRDFRRWGSAWYLSVAALYFGCAAGRPHTLASQGRPASVGVLTAVNGGEHTESVGFRLCVQQGPPLVVSVAHAARETGSVIDFGRGPEPLQLEIACGVGDVAIYSEVLRGHDRGSCLSLHDPLSEPVDWSHLQWLRPALSGSTDYLVPIHGEAEAVMVDEWVAPALVLASDLESGASGTPVLNKAGDVVGMAFGASRTAGTALATPRALIGDCIGRLGVIRAQEGASISVPEGRIAE